jgi:hypothetical protein
MIKHNFKKVKEDNNLKMKRIYRSDREKKLNCYLRARGKENSLTYYFLTLTKKISMALFS